MVSKIQDKSDIDSRIKIERLVQAFYTKVRADEMIGPIFNNQIHDWSQHIQTLSDFWETNLLGVRSYKGNPVTKHIEVDHKCKSTIQQLHFARWLSLWSTQIDDLYAGINAETAKRRARKMSTHLFLQMFKARR